VKVPSGERPVRSEESEHVPVLAEAVAAQVAVAPGEIVLDLTVGLGGHARMLAESAGKTGLLIGMDVDEQNLMRAAQRVEGSGCPYRLFRGNFREFGGALADAGVSHVDVILADLGVSSNQLAAAERGLSFQLDGPLDMRLDQRLTETAADLVNGLSEAELADIFYRYGQERHSRRIARAVHRARHEGRIATTGQLVHIVARALRVDPASRASKIHPATRVFQALRIAVNDELGALEAMLEKAPRYLRPGGRIAIISFHSLEDALVKADFRRRQQDGIYTILTNKPVVADEAERNANPRARSAKLRVARRTDYSQSA
jgi:16S rRNA (cytosine1402-N4)-methyltransferase